MSIYNKQAGFSLIELMIAIAFIAVTIVSIFRISAFNSYIRKTNTARTQAIYHAVQGLEASRLIVWSDLASGDHGLIQENNTWHLTSQPDLLDNKYLRTIRIEDVYRTNISNGNVYGDISSSSNLDPDSKKVIVTVSWTGYGGKQKEEVLETYLHRFRANRWSQIDWSGGAGQTNWSDKTKFDTKNAGIDVSVPGQATLLSGFLDWNNGTTTAALRDSLPGNLTVNDIFEKDNKAYIATNNNSSGNEFFIFNVSDINNPVALGAGFPVNATVSAVVVNGDYAYLATSRNNKQVLVLNISDPNNIIEAGYFNLGANAWDIAVGNNVAYAITDTRLYVVDISNLSQIHTPFTNVSIQGTGKVLFLLEDYIYVGAYSNNGRELQVFYVENPIMPVATNYYDLAGGSLTPTDIYVRGSRVYVSTQNSSSGAEFFVFDTTDPTSLLFLGSYNTDYTVYSFVIIGPYAILGINNSNQELIIIDISFPGEGGISWVNGFDLNGSKYNNQVTNYVYAMAANCSNIYMGTYNSSNSYELAIFSTREVDCGYADSGILESSIFDTGSDSVAYNWIIWEGAEPQNTDVFFQIATNNNISGPWFFVGPDGTSNTYYTNASQEFINYNQHLNQRYIRYKLFLSSQSGLQAPSVEKITISYSVY